MPWARVDSKSPPLFMTQCSVEAGDFRICCRNRAWRTRAGSGLLVQHGLRPHHHQEWQRSLCCDCHGRGREAVVARGAKRKSFTELSQID